MKHRLTLMESLLHNDGILSDASILLGKDGGDAPPPFDVPAAFAYSRN
ncbi:MAG: hypothetical protein KBF68_04455 [Nitrosomonas sp.]|nr:hypothetical protein [Nitrosomonas sp.]MBP9100626.1 hypothetical protein [Nitrosomonas sp.]